MPISVPGPGLGQPSVQYSSSSSASPSLRNPQFGRSYRALWEFVVLHHNVRSARGVICGNCQSLIINLAANQFSKRGCPLPPGVNRVFLDKLGASGRLINLKFSAIAKIIRQQGEVCRISRPDQFRQVLHTRWVAEMPEEFAAKLLFAHQHGYSLKDLHKNQPFAANAGPESYISVFKRYIAAVTSPCFGLQCTCRGNNWYTKNLNAKFPGDEETKLLIADGPCDWLVEMEMSTLIMNRYYYLAEEIRHVMERNTPPEQQYNDFISPIWHQHDVQNQQRPLATLGGKQWADGMDAAHKQLDHMYKEFAVGVSKTPVLTGQCFTMCKKYLEFQMEAKSWNNPHNPDMVDMVMANNLWDGPDQGTPGGKIYHFEAAVEFYNCLVFHAAGANQTLPKAQA